MNATIALLTWLVPLGALAGSPEAAEPNVPGVPVTVKLDVSARDDVKSQIYELIVAELQSRGIAQVVEDGAEWTIEIVTTTLEDGDGAVVAVGFSFIVEQHGIHMKMLLALAQACRYFIATGLLRDAPLESHMRLLLRGVAVLPQPDSLAVVSQHRMCVITVDKLSQVCHDVVVSFDTERLKAQGLTDPTAETEPNQPAAPVDEGQ